MKYANGQEACVHQVERNCAIFRTVLMGKSLKAISIAYDISSQRVYQILRILLRRVRPYMPPDFPAGITVKKAIRDGYAAQLIVALDRYLIERKAAGL